LKDPTGKNDKTSDAEEGGFILQVVTITWNIHHAGKKPSQFFRHFLLDTFGGTGAGRTWALDTDRDGGNKYTAKYAEAFPVPKGSSGSSVTAALGRLLEPFREDLGDNPPGAPVVNRLRTVRADDWYFIRSTIIPATRGQPETTVKTDGYITFDGEATYYDKMTRDQLLAPESKGGGEFLTRPIFSGSGALLSRFFVARDGERDPNWQAYKKFVSKFPVKSQTIRHYIRAHWEADVNSGRVTLETNPGVQDVIEAGIRGAEAVNKILDRK
jgi:hypothetical protein